MTVKISVYLGRFQPYHKGHAHLLTRAFETSDAVIILIGSAHQARTIKNPFTYEDRVRMISDWIEESGVAGGKDWMISDLRDQPYNNAKWIQTVQEKVASGIDFVKRGYNYERHHGSEPIEIILVGSDRDSSTWYLSAFPQWKSLNVEAVPEGRNLTATGLRDFLFSNNYARMWDDLPKSTIEFINKWIKVGDDFPRGAFFPNYSTIEDGSYFIIENEKTQPRVFRYSSEKNKWVFYETLIEPRNLSMVYERLLDEYEFIKRYKVKFAGLEHPPTFVTTDAVVIQSGHVLVVERAKLPGKGLWALPGGFINQNERLIDGTIRELIEETGIRLADGKRSLEITKDILRNSVKTKEIFDHPDRSLRGRTITTAFYFRLDDTKPLPKVSSMNAPMSDTGGKIVVETAWAKWIPIHEARAKSENWFEDHCYIVDTLLGMTKDA